MSEQNVELVRSWYASLPILRGTGSANDDATFDRFFRDYLDEGYEFRLPADYPEGEPVFRGRAGFARYTAMIRDAWSEWRFEPERFIDAGGDRVVVFQRVVAKGRASGLPVDARSASAPIASVAVLWCHSRDGSPTSERRPCRHGIGLRRYCAEPAQRGVRHGGMADSRLPASLRAPSV